MRNMHVTRGGAGGGKGKRGEEGKKKKRRQNGRASPHGRQRGFRTSLPRDVCDRDYFLSPGPDLETRDWRREIRSS